MCMPVRQYCRTSLLLSNLLVSSINCQYIIKVQERTLCQYPSNLVVLIRMSLKCINFCLEDNRASI